MYEKITNHMENIKRVLVPKGLRKIIFQTFHASKLLYTFPMTEPLSTIHVDAWIPGTFISYTGSKDLMVLVCHMTGFVSMEAYNEANAKEFSQAIYMIGLRYGLPNLIITDADSKFNSEFKKRCNLLNVKHHKAARNHFDSVLVERFIRFMSTSLNVFCSDRDSRRVFIEGAAMAIYAWNSAPVAITNLSRSALVVCGREFKFPIDFTNELHQSSINHPIHVKSYAADLF